MKSQVELSLSGQEPPASKDPSPAPCITARLTHPPRNNATCAPPTMSASTHSSATEIDASDTESPRVEALFLIRFDKKVGSVLLHYHQGA